MNNDDKELFKKLNAVILKDNIFLMTEKKAHELIDFKFDSITKFYKGAIKEIHCFSVGIYGYIVHISHKTDKLQNGHTPLANIANYVNELLSCRKRIDGWPDETDQFTRFFYNSRLKITMHLVEKPITPAELVARLKSSIVNLNKGFVPFPPLAVQHTPSRSILDDSLYLIKKKLIKLKGLESNHNVDHRRRYTNRCQLVSIFVHRYETV